MFRTCGIKRTWEKYAYFNVFYNVNEFTFFSRNFYSILINYQLIIADIVTVIVYGGP